MKRLIALCLMLSCADVDVGQVQQQIPAEPCTCPPDVPDCEGSPILLDLAGNGFQLTSVANGVPFDIFGRGSPMQVAWTAAGSDDAWLVYDMNGNGTIDGAQEMFGNNTLQALTPDPNGFPALQLLDDSGDGVIDARDGIYYGLRLWRDLNHDGKSQPGELVTLDQANVLSISYQYTTAGSYTDPNGNKFRQHAAVTYRPGKAGGAQAWDAWLAWTWPQVAPPGPGQTQDIITGCPVPPDDNTKPKRWRCNGRCWLTLRAELEATGTYPYSLCGGAGFPGQPPVVPIGTYLATGPIRDTYDQAVAAAKVQCATQWASTSLTNCVQCTKTGVRGGFPVAEALNCKQVQ